MMGSSEQPTKRFAYIDALRGYAVLAVLVVHVGQYAGTSGTVTDAGARGVQLFFVISAITLLTSWRHRNEGAVPFFIRRAFRILPMFWLAIALYWNPAVTAGQTIAAASLLQTIRPDWILGAIVPGGWSICTEAAFYCVFPLIARNVTTLKRSIGLLVGALILYEAWRVIGFDLFRAIFPWAAVRDLGYMQEFVFPKQLPVFGGGVVAYFIIPYLAKLSRISLEGLLILTVAAAAQTAIYHEYDVVRFGIIFAVGAVCMANGAGRYLVNEAIGHIGRCSFSIYLLHFKVAVFLAQFPIGTSAAVRFVTLFLGTAMATTAVATITYLVIEKPMIRLGNRLLRAPPLSTTATMTATP